MAGLGNSPQRGAHTGMRFAPVHRTYWNEVCACPLEALGRRPLPATARQNPSSVAVQEPGGAVGLATASFGPAAHARGEAEHLHVIAC